MAVSVTGSNWRFDVVVNAHRREETVRSSLEDRDARLRGQVSRAPPDAVVLERGPHAVVRDAALVESDAAATAEGLREIRSQLGCAAMGATRSQRFTDVPVRRERGDNVVNVPGVQRDLVATDDIVEVDSVRLENGWPQAVLANHGPLAAVG